MYCFLRLMVFLGLFLLTSCLYRMPTEDDVTMLPTTNNPSVTRDGSGPKQLPVPGISY